jgi:Sulfotransferase family
VIVQVIAKHGEPAPRLCNKDPFALKSTIDLSNMFPNARFLLMVRDGRAVAHSIVTRKVTAAHLSFDIRLLMETFLPRSPCSDERCL